MVKDGIVKIADFGISSDNFVNFSNVGTPLYKSPEIFQSSKTNAYTNKIDIWALNTCLFRLLTGNFYFSNSDNQSATYNIINKKFDCSQYNFSNCVAELLDLGY